MRRGRVSLLLLALSAFGCSPEDPPKPPPPPPPAETPPPPEPALPAPAEVAYRDWAEVDDEKFLELPAPSQAPELKWDFSAGKRYGYDFSETLSQRLERQANGKRALNTAREKNRGVFEFAAGRDRTALSVSKIQTQEASLNDQPLARESFAKKPPSVSECLVSEDGTAESKSAKGLADARMYFQSLFALQPGSRDLAPGKITTRIAGYAKVQRFDCARIESEFEISTDKPSEKLILRGRVIGYFAVAERKFVRASAAVATSSRGNALSKEGVWITSSLDAVTTYRVRLLE
jgi:hypothetical protein